MQLCMKADAFQESWDKWRAAPQIPLSRCAAGAAKTVAALESQAQPLAIASSHRLSKGCGEKHHPHNIYSSTPPSNRATVAQIAKGQLLPTLRASCLGCQPRPLCSAGCYNASASALVTAAVSFSAALDFQNVQGSHFAARAESLNCCVQEPLAEV